MSSDQQKSTSIQGRLPCGNPRRYAGRDVVRMSQEGASRGSKRKGALPIEPDDSKKTEAELHIQRLLQKQMKTDVTLSGHFSEHRAFSEVTEHRPGVDELVGVHGLQEYKLASDLDSKIDFLRHCGLDDMEITLKLRHEMQLEKYSKPSGYGADPESEGHKLKEIERKIQEKERQLQLPHGTKGALLLTRQEMEVEASHRQRYVIDEDTSGQGKMPSTFVIKSTRIEPAASHPDDPINHIPDMLTGLEGSVGKGEREPRGERRRRRKLKKKMEYYKQYEEGAEEGGTTSQDVGKIATDFDTDDECCHKEPNVLHGEVEDGSDGPFVNAANEVDKNLGKEEECSERLSPAGHSQEELAEATCAPRPADWVSAKMEKSKRKRPPPQPADEVGMRLDVNFITKESIAANKMAVEQIKEIHKFQTYSPGIPNRILFLKNLSSKTTVTNLMELFGCFQQGSLSRISFRLLTGRMKGQAFVTLPDEETAKDALDLVNGYLLHGSPVIVCYGKKT